MRRWVFLGLFAALVASQIWGPAAWRVFASRGIACGHFVIEVRGRLVDGVTGQPLAARAVCTLPRAESVQAPALAEAFAQATASARADPPGARRPVKGLWEAVPFDLDALGISDAEGGFQVLAMVWHSTSYIGDEPQGPEEPDPGESVQGLLIEALGGATPILVAPLPPGSLRWLPGGEGALSVRATWDLGDVRVPAAK